MNMRCMTAIYRVTRHIESYILLQSIWEVPLRGLWAATAASYCPSRIGELPKNNPENLSA